MYKKILVLKLWTKMLLANQIAGFFKIYYLMKGRVSQMGLTCEGTVWAKWPKTAWKLHNQHFWDKTVGRQANFLGSPLTRGNPKRSE